MSDKKDNAAKQEKMRNIMLYLTATVFFFGGAYGFIFPEKMDLIFGMGVETTKLFSLASMVIGALDFVVIKFLPGVKKTK